MRFKKNLAIIMFVFILISFVSISVFSQTNDENEQTYFDDLGLEIGAGFYSFCGSGFLFKNWFNEKFAFGFSLFPYADLTYNDFEMNIGIELNYRIKIYKRVSPYLYLGGLINYDGYYNSINFTTGLGFGIQWMILKNLDLQIHIGFGLINTTEFIFGGGVGLYFAF